MKSSIDPYCISQEESETRINEWKSGKYSIVPNGWPNGLPLDAFVFSINDFKDFVARVDQLQNSGITGVVCHVGIKDNSEGSKVPCLIFEAVENFSPDGDPGIRKGDLPPTGDPNGEPTTARYDFSFPCPPTCPSKA